MRKRKLKPFVKVGISLMLFGVIMGVSAPMLKNTSIVVNVEAKVNETVKTKKTVKKETFLYTTANVNLRKGASLKKPVIEVIPKSNKVTLVTTSGSWSKVKYGKHTGWVTSSLLKKKSKNLQSSLPNNNHTYVAPISHVKGAKYVNGVLIVNKSFGLPSNYNPGVDATAQKAVNDMTLKAKSEGVTLKTISAFRSYSYQKELFQKYSKRSGVKQAERYSARPGYSEHQTGLAFDFGGENQSHWLKTSFGETFEGKWLLKNADTFGFVLRYQPKKEKITGYMYEPWHFRYVGTDMATKIKQSGLTMEEYFHIVKK